MPTLHHWLTSTAGREQRHASGLERRLRAAADLKVLARHRQDPPSLACEGCGYDDSWPLTKNISDCPELLDMAAGYGLTPETIATLDRPTEPKAGPTFADVLSNAASHLRHGRHPLSMLDIAWSIAKLLDAVAESAAQDGGAIQNSTDEAALAVAREVLGQDGGQK
ncbi:hypothetical protein GCM10009639_53750 [Kitasatospora putterlickiae]|uniref:Uncharacterized protein n=1 Tax=Kitasatospora putterlickiae TaxID=221725 RepID=A0ABP4J1M3_9ACTN